MDIKTSYGLPLHDLFAFADGTRRVATAADWPGRRAELASLVQRALFGTLPPAPGVEPDVESIFCPVWHPNHRQFLVYPFGADDNFSLRVFVWVPQGGGPFPVIVDGDGCWSYMTPEARAQLLGAGYAIAFFNRCEIVPDVPPADRSTRFQRRFPGLDFGAIAGWAWGFHRVVDALPKFGMPLDMQRIVFAGHSRGGKASLLAGALDERAAIVTANGSGTGGAGCFRFCGENAEPLDAMLDNFPTWFAPSVEAYRGRQQDLPFDHHMTKALCAPRPLLLTESTDDRWANPAGCCITNRAAREVYALLGRPADTLGAHFRTGPHGHTAADWAALLAFCDHHFFGKPAPYDFLIEE